MAKREVPSLVKDKELIKKRRAQMIKAALHLFKEKGYHRTTTREIAMASGFSIGTLYEYIRSKEDILYLVCDSIYDVVYEKLETVIDATHANLELLKNVIISYCKVVDEIQEEIMFMYQETKSLSKEALPYVLKKEDKILDFFERLLRSCNQRDHLGMEEWEVKLFAHQIVTDCQMWSFRRWVLQRNYTLDQFSHSLANMVYTGLKHFKEVGQQEHSPSGDEIN